MRSPVFLPVITDVYFSLKMRKPVPKHGAEYLAWSTCAIVQMVPSSLSRSARLLSARQRHSGRFTKPSPAAGNKSGSTSKHSLTFVL
jgi:hypothetical protein